MGENFINLKPTVKNMGNKSKNSVKYEKDEKGNNSSEKTIAV